MHHPDDPETDSSKPEAILDELQETVEVRIRSLEEIDIDALPPEEARRLVRDLRQELCRQRERLSRARSRVPEPERRPAAEKWQCCQVEDDLQRLKRELLRQADELAAATARLANEKQFLTSVMEALPAGVAITDRQGAIIMANKAIERIWGTPMPKIRCMADYKHFQAWWGDTDIPVAPEEWAAAIAVQQGISTLKQMMRIKRFDGVEVFVLNSASPILDAEGNILGGAVVIEDITELKQIQKALFESEQRMRLFIEQAPVALAVFDREMRYLNCSRRWAEENGAKSRTLLGRSAYEVHDIPERWREANRRAMSGEVLGNEEDCYRRFDGSIRWIRWKIHPWYKASGEVGGIVVFTEDITERKRFEKELHALNEELEQRIEARSRELRETQAKYLHAEKLSAIGKLTASIAHEFNNPLQGIMNVLKGLKSSAAEDRDREMLELAIGETERLKKLIGNLREFNRPTSGEKTAVDVHAAIHSLLLLCKNDFRQKGLRVELELTEGLPAIPAVPDQIKQVLLNLLTNAADACAPGGRIWVRTWREGGRIAVAVSDDCVGIEADQLEKIFQPFYSTKEWGTGLGLAICDGIVGDHGGEIRVESAPGQGATFTILLPVTESDEAFRTED